MTAKSTPWSAATCRRQDRRPRGFLRRRSVTIISGVEDREVDPVLELTRRDCRARTELLPATALPIFEELPLATATKPMEVRSEGPTVFVLPIEHFERF